MCIECYFPSQTIFNKILFALQQVKFLLKNHVVNKWIQANQEAENSDSTEQDFFSFPF